MRELRLETHRCWQVAVEGDGITAAAAELFFFVSNVAGFKKEDCL